MVNKRTHLQKKIRDSDPPPCSPGMRKMYGIIEPRKSKSTKLCPGWYRESFTLIIEKKNSHFVWSAGPPGIIFKPFIYVNLPVPTFWGPVSPQTHAKISRNQTSTQIMEKNLQNPKSHLTHVSDVLNPTVIGF